MVETLCDQPSEAAEGQRECCHAAPNGRMERRLSCQSPWNHWIKVCVSPAIPARTLARSFSRRVESFWYGSGTSGSHRRKNGRLAKSLSSSRTMRVASGQSLARLLNRSTSQTGVGMERGHVMGLSSSLNRIEGASSSQRGIRPLGSLWRRISSTPMMEASDGTSVVPYLTRRARRQRWWSEAMGR